LNRRFTALALGVALAAILAAYGFYASYYKPSYKYYNTYVVLGEAETTLTSIAPLDGGVVLGGSVAIEDRSSDFTAQLLPNGSLQWSRNLWGGGRSYTLSLAPAPSGFYAAVHAYRGNRSLVYLVHASPSGEALWTAAVNGTAPAAVAASASRVYLVAHVRAGPYRLPLVAAFTPSGEPLWAMRLALTSYQGNAVTLPPGSEVTVYAAAAAGDGLLVAGTVYDPVNSIRVPFIAEISPSGRVERAYIVASPDPATAQGVAWSNGTIYLVGAAEQRGDRYAWMAEIRGWRLTGLLELNGNGSDVLRRALPAADALYLVGYTSSPPARGEDIYVAKLAQGKLQWQLCIGGGGNDFATDAALLPGRIAVAGVAQLTGGYRYGGIAAFLPESGYRGATEAYRPCRLARAHRPLRLVEAGFNATPLPAPRPARAATQDIYIVAHILVRHPVPVYRYRSWLDRVMMGVLPAAAIIDLSLLALLAALPYMESRRRR